jgi:hypothetical protein
MVDYTKREQVALLRDFLNVVGTETEGVEVRITQDDDNGMRFYSDADVLLEVHNDTGAQLDKGVVVYVSGTHTSGKPLVVKARSDSTSTMPAIGLVQADIANGAEGLVVVSGTLRNFDTSTPSWSAGDQLYVDASTAGAMTSTRPTASSQQVQKVAIVTRVHATAGSLAVVGASRTNDVPNEMTALTGVALDATNLGTFTGTTIADNETVKGALQDLETAVEATSVSTMLAVGTSTASVANTTVYASWDTASSDALADASGKIQIDDEDSGTDTSDATIVNIHADGRYLIDCSFRISGNNRVEAFCRTWLDTGSGFVRQSMHTASNYSSRDTDQNTGTVTLSTLLSLSDGDKLKFQAEADADGTANLVLNGTLLRIVRLT